jgi:hypothetical protein
MHVHFTCFHGTHPHSTLLPFVISVLFPGLLLDSTLSQKPHLTWLHIKWWSLNILKVSSGQSCGAGSAVTLWLYCSLVCSMLDYGSFTYGSATKSRLCIIEPVHKMGIPLTTGAFQTSHLECLCKIWETSTLLVEEYFLTWLCCEVCNAAQSPLTWCSILSQPLQQVWIKHDSLLTCGCVLSNSILANYPSNLPSLTYQKQITTSALMYSWCFTKLLSAYLDHMTVVTDGLFAHELTGCAFTYDGYVLPYHLCSSTSVFTSKLYAVHWALLFILHQTWKCHLLHTDSLGGSQSLNDIAPDYLIITVILSQVTYVYTAWKSVVFWYVPDHRGPFSNEATNAATKWVASFDRALDSDVCAFLHHANHAVTSLWQDKWTNAWGKKWHLFVQSVV